MSPAHEPAGPKILEKIKIHILSRAKLLCSLCHEIPCISLETPVFMFSLLRVFDETFDIIIDDPYLT